MSTRYTFLCFFEKLIFFVMIMYIPNFIQNSDIGHSLIVSAHTLTLSGVCKKEVKSRNSMQNLICSRWMLSVTGNVVRIPKSSRDPSLVSGLFAH